MLGGARWSAMLGGAKGTRTHVCPRPWLRSIDLYLKHAYKFNRIFNKLHKSLTSMLTESIGFLDPLMIISSL